MSTSNFHDLWWTRLWLPVGLIVQQVEHFTTIAVVGDQIPFVREFSGLSSLRLNIGFKTTAITSTLKIDSGTVYTNNNVSLCTFGSGLNRLCHWYFVYFEEVAFKKSHSKMEFNFRLSTSTKQMPHLYERMWLTSTTGGISSHKSQ